MKTIDVVLKEAVHELKDSHTLEEIMEIIHQRHQVRVEKEWVIHTIKTKSNEASTCSHE